MVCCSNANAPLGSHDSSHESVTFSLPDDAMNSLLSKSSSSTLTVLLEIVEHHTERSLGVVLERPSEAAAASSVLSEQATKLILWLGSDLVGNFVC